MKVGVPKEIKEKENRVALTPSGAQALTQAGHSVLVQGGAGSGSGFTDVDYAQTGAQLVSAETAWNTDLVLKVKEPLKQEYDQLRGQLLFTYLHLAGVTPALSVKDRIGETPVVSRYSACSSTPDCGSI